MLSLWDYDKKSWFKGLKVCAYTKKSSNQDERYSVERCFQDHLSAAVTST